MLRRIHRRSLEASWLRESTLRTIDPRIPDPAINYNQDQAASYSEYVSGFIERACEHELPALLEIGGPTESEDPFVFLDYGCGLGRLAYAFTEHFGRDEHRQYIGYEIHPDATAFLLSAYADYPNVSVVSERIALQDSYVEIRQGASDSSGRPADDVELAGRIGRSVDLQFSHSVFTHMYRQAIVHVLRELCEIPVNLAVNTWLLVDEEARANIGAGRADRRLPIKGDGFWTYDRANPLMCTAYDFDVMQELYAEGGHEIVEVKWGTWSGREPSQDFTYQDVVISRPRL